MRNFIVTAPDRPAVPPRKPSVFLAGGITGCPFWQDQMIKLLNGNDLTIYNPRRANFNTLDRKAEAEQIIWEYDQLTNAKGILFWFPKDNQAGCPITLFELGRWSYSKKDIFVGVEPGYTRESDVRIQMKLERYGMAIHDTLEDLAEEVLEWI